MQNGQWQMLNNNQYKPTRDVKGGSHVHCNNIITITHMITHTYLKH